MNSVFIDTSASPMSSLTSKALLNKLRNHRTTNKDGFTLIELLIVVIIVGVLSSVALPAFIGQAAKAKIASAKALASTAAKECQTYLVGDQLATFTLTTKGGGDIRFPGTSSTCTLAAGATFTASIPKGGSTFDRFTATVAGGTGAVTKTCEIAVAGTTAVEEVKDGCTITEINGTTGTW